MNNLKVQSNRSLQFKLDAIEHDNFTPLSVQFERSILDLFGAGATFRIDWELSNGSNYFMGTYNLIEKLEVRIPNNVFAIAGVLYVQVRISDDEGKVWHSEKKHVYVNDSIESEIPATLDDKIYVEVPAEFVEGNVTSYNPESGRLVDIGESVADVLGVIQGESQRQADYLIAEDNRDIDYSGREDGRDNLYNGREEDRDNLFADAETNRNLWELFDDTKRYNLGNKVSYLGSSYVAHTMPPIGTLPTDTSYYTLIAKKGDKGDIGEVSQEDLDTALELKVDKTTLTAHENDTMPHQAKDLKENKTYIFGVQLSEEGIPQLIYEEVI